MDLKTKLKQDLVSAMKAGQSVSVSSLRMLQSEIKKREIDSRKPMEEGDLLKLIQTLIKQRNDSIAAFKQGGRDDLVQKEQAEIDVLMMYLPQQLTPAELEVIVAAAIEETKAAGPKDMGKVMKAVLAKSAGRADGKIVNDIVRAKLGG